MSPLYENTWLLLCGFSFILLGGFVLWAYAAPAREVEARGPEADAVRAFHATLGRRYFLFGVALLVIGICCLMTIAPLML